MFIEKLKFTADLEQVRKDLDTILIKADLGVENQIGLTYRPNATDRWKDSTGSLYDRVNNVELIKESEFTEFNNETPEYTANLLKKFSQEHGFEIGRARFMRLPPKTGLTVHADNTVRYHLVIYTNENAFIAHIMKQANISAVCFHIPANQTFYKVDTTRKHFVYNGGQHDRIHLVISPKD